MTSALMAFSVMLRPHVELTEVTLTDSAATLASVAKACCTSCRLATDWSPTWINRTEPDADVRSCTFASVPLMP